MHWPCRTDLTEYERATGCKSKIQRGKKDALAVLPHVDKVGHNVKWRKEVNPQVWEAETSFYFESL